MLRDLAVSNPKIVTQMGNQGHSSDTRAVNEWVQAGITAGERGSRLDRSSVVYWPQGVPLPTAHRGRSPPEPVRKSFTFAM